MSATRKPKKGDTVKLTPEAAESMGRDPEATYKVDSNKPGRPYPYHLDDCDSNNPYTVGPFKADDLIVVN